MNRARYLIAAGLLGAPLPAAAQPTERTAIVYGNDPCPTGGESEIVVCARRPERERYRIPRELRGEGEPLSETSWGARTRTVDDAGREQLPGSCSTVGSYGQTGCRQRLLDQWYDERAEKRRRRSR